MNTEDIIVTSSSSQRAYATLELQLDELVTFERLLAICDDHIGKYGRSPGFAAISQNDYIAIKNQCSVTQTDWSVVPPMLFCGPMRVIAMPSLKPGMVVLGYAE